MARRISNGRHQREISSRDTFSQLQDRNIIFDIFTRAAGERFKQHLGLAIELDQSATTALEIHRKQGGSQEPHLQRQSSFETSTSKTANKTWALAGEGWVCPCCARTKIGICRKSNAGSWTAKIHRFREFLLEDNADSICRRLGSGLRLDHNRISPNAPHLPGLP